MDLKKKCLDTYALVEIAKGNPLFAGYFSQEVVITDLTLMEFYYVLLREENETGANHWLNKLEPYAMSVKREVLIEAAKFRYQHRKQNLSFFDAVGYLFSLKTNCIFVTGDKEFEHFEEVEFRR